MTSSHPNQCDAFREDFLVGLCGPDAQGAPEGGHVAVCEPCEHWSKGAALGAGFLGSMDRLVAPRDLEERLALDLEIGVGDQLGALRGLGQLSAPAGLDQLVAQDLAKFSAETPAPSWTPLLEQLPRAQAPSVLDRLVAEELADKEKATTKRFLGGLTRQRSPRALEARVHSNLQAVSKRGLPMRRSMAWGSAAAAALLVWISMPNFSADAQTPELRFQVVEVADIQDLSPFARSLASNFMGLDPNTPDLGQPKTDGGGL